MIPYNKSPQLAAGSCVRPNIRHYSPRHAPVYGVHVVDLTDDGVLQARDGILTCEDPELAEGLYIVDVGLRTSLVRDG